MQPHASLFALLSALVSIRKITATTNVEDLQNQIFEEPNSHGLRSYSIENDTKEETPVLSQFVSEENLSIPLEKDKATTHKNEELNNFLILSSIIKKLPKSLTSRDSRRPVGRQRWPELNHTYIKDMYYAPGKKPPGYTRPYDPLQPSYNDGYQDGFFRGSSAGFHRENDNEKYRTKGVPHYNYSINYPGTFSHGYYDFTKHLKHPGFWRANYGSPSFVQPGYWRSSYGQPDYFQKLYRPSGNYGQRSNDESENNLPKSSFSHGYEQNNRNGHTRQSNEALNYGPERSSNPGYGFYNSTHRYRTRFQMALVETSRIFLQGIKGISAGSKSFFSNILEHFSDFKRTLTSVYDEIKKLVTKPKVKRLEPEAKSSRTTELELNEFDRIINARINERKRDQFNNFVKVLDKQVKKTTSFSPKATDAPIEILLNNIDTVTARLLRMFLEKSRKQMTTDAYTKLVSLILTKFYNANEKVLTVTKDDGNMPENVNTERYNTYFKSLEKPRITTPIALIDDDPKAKQTKLDNIFNSIDNITANLIRKFLSKSQLEMQPEAYSKLVDKVSSNFDNIMKNRILHYRKETSNMRPNSKRIENSNFAKAFHNITEKYISLIFTTKPPHTNNFQDFSGTNLQKFIHERNLQNRNKINNKDMRPRMMNSLAIPDSDHFPQHGRSRIELNSHNYGSGVLKEATTLVPIRANIWYPTKRVNPLLPISSMQTQNELPKAKHSILESNPIKAEKPIFITQLKVDQEAEARADSMTSQLSAHPTHTSSKNPRLRMKTYGGQGLPRT